MSGVPYELRIGRRYLRSTGNRFLSFISLISMLGVAIGVAVLIVVLSVMNGFERELRSRILSVTSHATVMAFGEGLQDWPALREQALANPGIRAVAPYVEGEALLIGEREDGGQGRPGLEQAARDDDVVVEETHRRDVRQQQHADVEPQDAGLGQHPLLHTEGAGGIAQEARMGDQVEHRRKHRQGRDADEDQPQVAPRPVVQAAETQQGPLGHEQEERQEDGALLAEQPESGDNPPPCVCGSTRDRLGRCDVRCRGGCPGLAQVGLGRHDLGSGSAFACLAGPFPIPAAATAATATRLAFPGLGRGFGRRLEGRNLRIAGVGQSGCFLRQRGPFGAHRSLFAPAFVAVAAATTAASALAFAVGIVGGGFGTRSGFGQALRSGRRVLGAGCALRARAAAALAPTLAPRLPAAVYSTQVQ